MTFKQTIWWLEQSAKRDAAQAAVELAYQKTGHAPLPPESEWRNYPCDVCARRVGPTGHIEVTLAVFPDSTRHAFMQVRCAKCYAYFEKQVE